MKEEVLKRPNLLFDPTKDTDGREFVQVYNSVFESLLLVKILLNELGDPKEAIEICGNICADDLCVFGGKPLLYYAVGCLQLYVDCMVNERQEKLLVEASKALTRAVTLDEGDWQLAFYAGLTFGLNKNINAAIKWAEHSLQLYSGYVETWFLLADLLTADVKYAEALAVIEAGLMEHESSVLLLLLKSKILSITSSNYTKISEAERRSLSTTSPSVVTASFFPKAYTGLCGSLPPHVSLSHMSPGHTDLIMSLRHLCDSSEVIDDLAEEVFIREPQVVHTDDQLVKESIIDKRGSECLTVLGEAIKYIYKSSDTKSSDTRLSDTKLLDTKSDDEEWCRWFPTLKTTNQSSDTCIYPSFDILKRYNIDNKEELNKSLNKSLKIDKSLSLDSINKNIDKIISPRIEKRKFSITRLYQRALRHSFKEVSTPQGDDIDKGIASGPWQLRWGDPQGAVNPDLKCTVTDIVKVLLFTAEILLDLCQWNGHYTVIK
eukprot:GHVL01020567.1.p1 GENE.GHVL01020567.1~~GHVL01020567.1.p1  ORF type:complete len:551 (+),score=130.19 GHVL01020567.1:184-1653(+)